jgi:polysaccharide chain length determinant protein (PEP-CTERM system associated)
VNRTWSSTLLGGNGEQAPARPLGRRLRFADYLEAPLHHPWWVIVPFLLTVTLATAVAFLVPKRYTSSCLVLIKASRVPEKIIANVADELDARRHQTIRQEILSRTRLEKVNEELKPYPDAPTAGAAVEALGRATQVEFKGSDAFSIQFSHGDPHVAQNVTNRLASLFIEEFRRSRRGEVEGAADFLDVELRDARTQLDAKEEALRRYKEANMGRLPEQLQASLSTLQRLQLELQGLDQNLEAAQARLERLTSRGAASESTAASPTGGPSERESLELELARLRQRYTDEHPDVRALMARLKAMGPAPGAGVPGPGPGPGATVATQIESARGDVNTLLSHRQSVRDQITTLQARVEQMPRTEQELSVLNRDFSQLRENYQGLLRKKMEAQTAERLQQRWTEDFEILDPARLPEHHAFPNRPLFIVAGIVVGLCLGLGAALLSEVFSPYVISADDLESMVSVPVLAILPVVEPQEVTIADRYHAAKRAAKPRHRPSGPRASTQ